MPRIVVQARVGDDELSLTLSERVVAANLDSVHYTAQLIERLAWATADAEAFESESAGDNDERLAFTRDSEPREAEGAIDAASIVQLSSLSRDATSVREDTDERRTRRAG